MECKVCNIEKLSSEYPPRTITNRCTHGVFECLRCTIKTAEDGKCPHAGCESQVSTEEDKLNLRWFKAIIARKFKVVVVESTQMVEKSDQADYIKDNHSELKIIMVNGNQIRIPYQPDMEVFVLKQRIEEKSKIPLGEQRLFFDGNIIESLKEHKRLRLSENKIGPKSSIYLARILCELPCAIDQITFKIDWGYPESKITFFFNLFTWTTRRKDYLDASCLLYSLGPDRIHKHDFTVNHKTRYYNDAIEHSGDVLDEKKKRGEHVIWLELQKLPTRITHLFFTLSSRITDALKSYKDPKLEVHDHAEDKPLTETSLENYMLLGSSVVVCCLYLSEDKIWRVMDIRRSTNGKVSNYHAIEQMIDGIFKDVFCYTYSK